MSTPVRAATVVAWLGAVVAATVVGLTAVDAIGAGIVGPGQEVLDAAEVDDRLAAAPAPPPQQTTTDPPPAPLPAESEVISSAGGSVVARCVDGRPWVVSATPAQGFSLGGGGGGDDGDDDSSGPGSGDDDSSGPGSGDDDSSGPGFGDDRVRFDDGEVRVELQLACVDGRVTHTRQIDD